MKYIAVILVVLGLQACSQVPDELAVAEGTNLTPFSQALTDPGQSIGQPARWGGVIAEIRNTDDGTEIEVVNFPLRGYGRPQVGDNSDGRFRAVLPSFVDPVVYARGKSVTFMGTVAASVEGKINDYSYTFPVLNVTGKYLWKDLEQRQQRPDYSDLWFRNHYLTPPYRIYYPVPVPVTPPQDNN
ncbi:Slp family lipoprotein [Pseudidiomarina mangrovi]|uniref:Slp family lipoprotein n=1 Tax=Pseudidiomarina mangrovi TaxID=2487133 RepID=UPI000FCB2E2B|nr:Slp family lipoprotein [Pseudidiomarina mangrovi]